MRARHTGQLVGDSLNHIISNFLILLLYFHAILRAVVTLSYSTIHALNLINRVQKLVNIFAILEVPNDYANGAYQDGQPDKIFLR